MITNCFIIMGFNTKVMEDGREYNLDLSYEKILKPVLEKFKIKYIRADEIMMSEIIDESMYRLLLCADLVIADITTLNPNALYELGVRYALKPFSTIIIGDKNTRFPFDINHIRIFSYEHLGNDIKIEEVNRMQRVISTVINNIKLCDSNIIDSPVYKYLPGLLPPSYPEDRSYFSIAINRFKSSDSLCNLVNAAYNVRDSGDFKRAEELYKKALQISKDDYIIKEIAVCMYQENTLESLLNALNFITNNIDVNSTVNPEVLKTLGTIYKKLWVLERNIEYAQEALNFYERSYVLFHAYNSGLNYGLMLFVVSKYQSSEKATQMKHWARYIYQQTKLLCLKNYTPSDYWVNASLEECCYALDEIEEQKKYTKIAENCLKTKKNSSGWKRTKTLEQLKLLSEVK